MAQMFGLARLGRDAEVRYTPKGDAVSNLSLAFDYRTKEGKATQWVDGVLWGRQAEALNEYLLKGKLFFFVLDDVHIEEFESGGETRHKLSGRVSKVDFASSKNDGEAEPRVKPEPRAKPARPPAKTDTGFDDMDDDVPF
jgi:single-strand DNA-binding protein